MYSLLFVSFFNWELVTNFLWKGFVFSIQLTLVAMSGGIVLGTLLALARLSPRAALANAAAAYVTLMRSITEVLFPLGDDCIVHSGHGPDTTIGRERTRNPFVLEYLAAR